MTCDTCGFKALTPQQITVWHCDGDLNNTQPYNLRSVCLNCAAVTDKKRVTWRRGDLEVD